MKKYFYISIFNIINISKYIYKIYNWILFSLLITLIISFNVIKIPYFFKIFFLNKFFLFTILSTQLIIVFLISNFINIINTKNIILLFIIYSILKGIFISNIFLIYTYNSIKISFLICNIIFYIMSIIGYNSKNNLIKIENFSSLLIIITIISIIINIILKNSLITYIISYINILLFSALILWDIKKLREIELNVIKNNNKNKYSILGALILYLNFINLYLFILELSGIKIIKK